jgi:hypothetical protein
MVNNAAVDRWIALNNKYRADNDGRELPHPGKGISLSELDILIRLPRKLSHRYLLICAIGYMLTEQHQQT